MYISVENLYIFYGRIPNKKEPPFDYIELVRGTSDYSPKEIESAYYGGLKIKLGKYSLLPMDVLVWFEHGQPVVVLVGETTFERQNPDAGQRRALLHIWFDYITDELSNVHRFP